MSVIGHTGQFSLLLPTSSKGKSKWNQMKMLQLQCFHLIYKVKANLYLVSNRLALPWLLLNIKDMHHGGDHLYLSNKETGVAISFLFLPEGLLKQKSLGAAGVDLPSKQSRVYFRVNTPQLPNLKKVPLLPPPP